MSEQRQEEDASLLAMATLLLRRRRFILGIAFLGGVLGATVALVRAPRYVARASFPASGSDAARAGLAGLAGQLGVAIPGNAPSSSPDFYAKLIQSRAIMGVLVHDTVALSERGGERISLLDLLEIDEEDPRVRDARGIEAIRELTSVSVSKITGIVDVSVQTRWASVSAQIAGALLAQIDSFNQRSRQTQGGAERKFLARRLEVLEGEIDFAQERLSDFLRANRDVSSSPALRFEREHLEGELAMRRQLQSVLVQGYEEARIREVRDTPMISVVETPVVPALQQARGVAKTGVLGAFAFLVFAAVGVLARQSLQEHVGRGDSDVAEFLTALGDAAGWLRRFVRPSRQSP